jgi:hypothetical protein
MEAALLVRDARRPEASAGGSSKAVWGVRGVMAKDILPEEPAQRRRRRRLYALRAMDRLGLLGEENLIPTLSKRPALRWLADEEGARWAILTELGRIGEPEAFEQAVRWVLENRAHTEEAKAYICRFRSGATRPRGATGRIGRSRIGGRRAVCILAGHQGRRSGGDARSVLAHTTPTDEKGKKKVAWAVGWLTLVMGVMIPLSMVLPL